MTRARLTENPAIGRAKTGSAVNHVDRPCHLDVRAFAHVIYGARVLGSVGTRSPGKRGADPDNLLRDGRSLVRVFHGILAMRSLRWPPMYIMVYEMNRVSGDTWNTQRLPQWFKGPGIIITKAFVVKTRLTDFLARPRAMTLR